MATKPPSTPSADIFQRASVHLLEAVLKTADSREVHASEDIYDTSGMKLWAKGKLVSSHIVQRLSGCKLRKPIELCIYCGDPVGESAILQTVEKVLAESDAVKRLVSGHAAALDEAIRAAVPNPTELLLISLLRFGQREIFTHAVTVMMIAVALATARGYSPKLRQQLVRAAMLHDVGELYLDPALFATGQVLTPDGEREIARHPVLGACAARELAGVDNDVASAIAQSHERLDGTGYPDGVTTARIGVLARPLLVAESIAAIVTRQAHGLIRAAIATRMIPGEFPSEFVDLIYTASRNSPPPTGMSAEVQHAAHQGVCWVKDAIRRLRPLVNAPNAAAMSASTQAIQARLRRTLGLIEHTLDSTGVAEPLATRESADTEFSVEEFEAAVLADELLYRMRRLYVWVNSVATRHDVPTIADTLKHVSAMLDDGLLEHITRLRNAQRQPR
jgi:hypothetical protein